MISEYIEFDKNRNFSDKVPRAFCYAPFVNLMFDTRGSVRACCQSVTHSLGNITQQSLSEIWFGEVAEKLREEMKAYTLQTGAQLASFR